MRCKFKETRMKNLIIFSFFLSALLAGCTSSETCGYRPENVKAQTDISIERLDREILSLKNREEIRNFIQREPVIAEYFLLRQQYPNDSLFVEELYRRFTNPHIDTLQMEIDRVFGDLSTLENELESAFDLLRHYYPDTKVPRVRAVATGFDYDLMVSDSLIIIGLDYYLGEEAKYDYILRRYEPKFIVPSIMLLTGISTEYNKGDKEDISILADMISYGKSYYFAKRMLPCTPDSVLIWYSDREIQGVRANDDVVWSHFLENNLLWESSHLVKRKYLDERPKTYEIGAECPPRVATWLGWEIVKSFMEEYPETTLRELMEMDNARKLFEASRYRPGD